MSSVANAETITNTATANYSVNGTPQILSDSVQFDTVVIPTIPLVIDKQANVETANIGDTILFTIKISNPNSKDIPAIKVEDLLPVGLEIKTASATLNHNSVAADISNGLTFHLGNIPANSEWLLSYEAVVKNTITSRELINQATATSTDIKANSNTDSVTVNIIDDVISLDKSADTQKVNIGNVVNYTVTLSNPSKHALTNIIIRDTLPNGFIYQAGTAVINEQPVTSSNASFSGNSLEIRADTLAINNSLVLKYQVIVSEAATSGEAINQAQASSDFASSDIVTATVKVRTPSTINFLKIDDNGEISLIPSSSFNSDQNGGKNWQEINSIPLPNGSVIALPTPQPIIDATEYTVSDPVIIEVIDLDQNEDPLRLETIIVTVEIPGTNDKEILLLTETASDSGVFRGAVLLTTAPTKIQNGLLTIADDVKINVTYRDDEDSTDTSATAALIIPDTSLILSKRVDKNTASIGELVKYTLEFRNTTRFDLPALKLEDLLPVGFRYVSNTASLNGELLTNGIQSNGRSLIFNLSNMPAGSLWSIEYLSKITAGVQIGKAINMAYLTSGSLQSNHARATVNIKDELMRSRNILTGRVYIGCETKTKDKIIPKVLKDARIYMETGRSVLSDEEGFWHMEGVLPGSHVLQLDKESLPTGYEPILCSNNTRHAGDAKSQFVDLQAGSLWHVDFHVNATETSIEINSKHNEKSIINPVEQYGMGYLREAPVGFEVLWPKNNYVPPVASTKIFVKSSPQHQIELILNGKKVNNLNYDGSDTNKAQTVTIRRWTGVDIDIKNRNNALIVILKDKSGKEISRETRNIHFSGKPAYAEYLPEESVLIADGRSTPTIALRIKDEDGFPMRANTHGYFKLENSNYQIKTLDKDKDRLNLNESLAGEYKYTIEEGGIARIELNPTTQSGEVKLSLII